MTNFGDAEAAVVSILRSDPGLFGTAVATDLVGYQGGRWLRVSRTGGIPTLWMRIDNPVIEIAAYGGDKETAMDLAVAARSAVHEARASYVGNGLALFDVMDAEGITWSPDENDPDLSRYLLSLVLVTKPYAPEVP